MFVLMGMGSPVPDILIGLLSILFKIGKSMIYSTPLIGTLVLLWGKYELIRKKNQSNYVLK